MNYILDARTVTPHFPGIGRYVGNLVHAIPPLLNSSESLTILQAPGSALEVATSEKISVIKTHASPFGLSQQWQLPPRLKPAAVYHSPYYLMPYRPGIPTVLTIYDMIPLRFPQLVSLRARLMFRLTTRLAIDTADHIICISSATRKDLLAEFPFLDPKSVSVIPLAPAAQFSPQSSTEQKRVREKFQLPKEFGLYLGINKPHKNLLALVRAWTNLNPDMPLVIGGAWDDRYPEAKQLAEKFGLIAAGKVRFIGQIPDSDLPALYSACRLFIFPSKFEGFGLPVIEAMACGTNVVCSNTSSLPEVGGDAARYFDPEKQDSIQMTISDALRSTRDSAASIEQAANFTWGKTASATLAIYRSITYNNLQNDSGSKTIS